MRQERIRSIRPIRLIRVGPLFLMPVQAGRLASRTEGRYGWGGLGGCSGSLLVHWTFSARQQKKAALGLRVV